MHHADEPFPLILRSNIFAFLFFWKTVQHTKEKVSIQIASAWTHDSVEELNNNIGLRVLAGVYGANNGGITLLRNIETGRPILGENYSP